MSTTSRDPRRRFTQRERTAMYLAAGGICPRCGKDLDTDFHGDHRLAWSRGGATDVTNGDALCPDCNRAKGASSTSIPEDHPAARPVLAAVAVGEPTMRHSTPSAPSPGFPVNDADDKCHKEIS
jgi:5-methylcytosine-specific restriction endonuclease McrA